MITATTVFWRSPFIILPVLATGLWLVSQKSCELAPDLAPTYASARAETRTPQPISTGGEGTVLPYGGLTIAQLPDAKRRSLKQASALLRQAADSIDNNEGQAIGFIRQAIAILKYETIREVGPPDYDRVSMRIFPLLRETSGRRS